MADPDPSAFHDPLCPVSIGEDDPCRCLVGERARLRDEIARLKAQNEELTKKATDANVAAAKAAGESYAREVLILLAAGGQVAVEDPLSALFDARDYLVLEFRDNAARAKIIWVVKREVSNG